MTFEIIQFFSGHLLKDKHCFHFKIIKIKGLWVELLLITLQYQLLTTFSLWKFEKFITISILIKF